MDEIVAKLGPAIGEEAALLEEQRNMAQRAHEMTERLSVLQRGIHATCDALLMLGIEMEDHEPIRRRCIARRQQLEREAYARRVEAIA